jgi:hypothetical protein
MISRTALLVAGAVAALAAAAPAVAVGLGPLSKEGSTATSRKAFYLTLINPYTDAQTFRAVAVDFDDQPIDRVKIVPAVTTLAGESRRQLVVIANGLTPGEEYKFKVCAALAVQNEGTLHARVCSKLTARRLAASGS